MISLLNILEREVIIPSGDIMVIILELIKIICLILLASADAYLKFKAYIQAGDPYINFKAPAV